MDEKYTRVLRNIIAKAFGEQDYESLTLKRVRAAAETELGLDEDFFKTDPTWKAKSKDIVGDEVARQESLADAQETGNVEQAPNSKHGELAERAIEVDSSKGKPKRKPTPSKASDEPRSKKRKPPPPPSNTIRERTSTARSLEKRPSKSSVPAQDSDSSLSSLKTSHSEPKATVPDDKSKRNTSTPVVTKLSDDDSDLSSLLDEPLPPKKRRKSKIDGDGPKRATKTSRKPLSKPSATSSGGGEDELKRLQSWLLKCGVRKQWKKELDPFDSEREKVKHLKSMLEDLGMTGRFSEDKARRIKEQREFEREMADIKEGAKAWGRDAEEAEEDLPTRRRRLQPKGLQDILDIPGLDDSD